MLFTRCPACQTTFRISEEMLRKAAGQVRCGRCSNIFNAHRELRESIDAPKPRAAPAPGGLKPAPWPEIVETPADSEPKLRAVAVPPVAPSGESTTGTEGPKELSSGREHAAETSVERLLEPEGGVPLAAELWTLTPVAPPAQSRLWTAAVAVAGFVLLVQVANSFSDVLATSATLGPLVKRAYGALGLSLVPRWDLDQYEVIRATAATTPGASGRGSLVITAGIRNRGTLALPYPHLQLRLLDRWEQTVGKRAFAPVDYLASSGSSDAMLGPGGSITVELVVVDPGPDAAGFEIDVCTVGVSRLRCAADDVFE